MSEWDFEEQTSSNQNQSFSAGNWDVVLTIVVFLSVSAVSFLVSWLTREDPSRSFWKLGLCFAAPVAALMLSAFLKEKVSSSMTPTTSRNAQFILVMCSILAAFAVGCFCQVSNTEAKEVTEVRREGWSNILFILDKSSSMSGDRDQAAASAMTEMLNEMEDDIQVALLIDSFWNTDLKDREIGFGPLGKQRNALIRMAQMKVGSAGDFPKAFTEASRMVSAYTGDKSQLTVIVLSDGDDVTGQFRASDYEREFIDSGVKVQYLYVDPNHMDELSKLAQSTGGKSLYVSDLSRLKDEMRQTATRIEIEYEYKDALRNIDDSDSAKIVTGILLLLLGVLVGISLTVMFSVQGQRRFQMILSPSMAVMAFLILSFGKELLPESWIREGVAFSLFGIVLMRSNRGHQVIDRKKEEGIKPSPVKDNPEVQWDV